MEVQSFTFVLAPCKSSFLAPRTRLSASQSSRLLIPNPSRYSQMPFFAGTAAWNVCFVWLRNKATNALMSRRCCGTGLHDEQKFCYLGVARRRVRVLDWVGVRY